MKYIKCINIENSQFFEDLEIKFSDKLNCIMGGRGTGKTTIMNFIWATIDENVETNKEIYNLLKTNLGNGKITLLIEDIDGTEYKIVKTLNDQPQIFELPNENPIPYNQANELLRCDFYPALKIESIGRSPKERLELLDKKLVAKLPEIQNELRLVQEELKSNARDILSLTNKTKSISELVEHYGNIEEQFELHKKKNPKGISEKEKKEFEKADSNEKKRKDEKRIYNKWFEFNTTFKNSLNKYKKFVEDFKTNNEINLRELLNTDALTGTKNSIDVKLNSYLTSIESLIKETNDDEIEKLFNELSDIHAIQQTEFIKVKQRFEANREYINQFNSLSKKVNEKKNLIKDHKEIQSKEDSFWTTRKELLNQLDKLKHNIYNLRYHTVNKLNETFKEEIRITLKPGGITDKFEEALRSVLKGSGLRYNEIIYKIIENFTPNDFADIVHKKNVTKLKEIVSIDEIRANTLIQTFHATQEIFDIECLFCEDLPDFSLKIQGQDGSKFNFKKTEELSLGQRCTTILPIVFSVSNNPLIIDQPEDNLDNRFITSRIHEIVRDQKEKRQLIFITHNPNIPVLSDSDYNIFLKYDFHSRILNNGLIEEVKNEILDLLEGGKEAFDRRSSMYNS